MEGKEVAVALPVMVPAPKADAEMPVISKERWEELWRRRVEGQSMPPRCGLLVFRSPPPPLRPAPRKQPKAKTPSANSPRSVIPKSVPKTSVTLGRKRDRPNTDPQ